MKDERKDDYINWLENFCLTLLDSAKTMTGENLIKNIAEKGISIEDDFIKCLIEKLNRNQEEYEIKRKLPLLKTYPIGLKDDIYFGDEEKIYKWTIDTINKLLSKLLQQYRDKPVLFDAYCNFFDKEIKPYEEYLNTIYENIYEMISPDGAAQCWSYRINKNIPWDKSWGTNNIGIAVISIMENCLNKDARIDDFMHLIGAED